MTTKKDRHKKSRQWVYRPTEDEHELVLKAVKESEFKSVAQFIREGALRLAHDEDIRPLYTEVGELIEELVELKEKFLNLVLKHSEGP